MRVQFLRPLPDPRDPYYPCAVVYRRRDLQFWVAFLLWAPLAAGLNAGLTLLVGKDWGFKLTFLPLVVVFVLHFRRMAPRCPHCGRLYPY